MPRPQFRLRSLFILTAGVAVGCAAALNAKHFGVTLAEGAIIGLIAGLMIAARWPAWNDRRLYDRWPRTGVFPKPESNSATCPESDSAAQEIGRAPPADQQRT